VAPPTKRIADPVHGTIPLLGAEIELLDSPAFQRLRNVKQLGLAAYVFPGADFSRLSHSLGVCHVAGRIVDSLGDLPDKEQVRASCRIAALLHDIGHYPFSHTMEHALEKKFKKPVAVPAASKEPVAQGSGALDHEAMAAILIDSDQSIAEILKRNEVDPARVARLIRGKGEFLGSVLKSDLDADRIDYLMRTALHTGLPFGNIDLGYLLTQVRLDDVNQLCFRSRAINSIDHSLLARYFDRVQVAFHKSVAGLERLMQDVLIELLNSDTSLKWAADDMEKRVQDGTWAQFDDAYIIRVLRETLDTTKDKLLSQQIRAILDRRPLKLVAWYEYLGERSEKERFEDQKSLVESKLASWRAESELPYWTLWEQPGFALTTPASTVPLPLGTEKLAAEELEQSVHILEAGKNRALPIVKVESSLMKVLSNRVTSPSGFTHSFPTTLRRRSTLSARWSRRILSAKAGNS
jgi:HD superfamily phosphohydrolase